MNVIGASLVNVAVLAARADTGTALAAKPTSAVFTKFLRVNSMCEEGIGIPGVEFNPPVNILELARKILHSTYALCE